jgi:hypothetical protein
MAGLSVLACLPGSKIELKSWNLQSWGKSVLQNITYCYLHSTKRRKFVLKALTTAAHQ